MRLAFFLLVLALCIPTAAQTERIKSDRSDSIKSYGQVSRPKSGPILIMGGKKTVLGQKPAPPDKPTTTTKSKPIVQGASTILPMRKINLNSAAMRKAVEDRKSEDRWMQTLKDRKQAEVERLQNASIDNNYPNLDYQGHEGQVYVNGYYRSDGTYVKPYWKRSSESEYKTSGGPIYKDPQKTVHVNSYTKKDGTVVREHNRRPPSK